MQIGDIISFDLLVWVGEDAVKKNFESKVVSKCEDPLGFHETKLMVEINGEGYGIPLSEIKKVYPKKKNQLTLF